MSKGSTPVDLGTLGIDLVFIKVQAPVGDLCLPTCLLSLDVNVGENGGECVSATIHYRLSTK